MAVFYHAKPKPSRINKLFERDCSLMGLAICGGPLISILAGLNLDGPDNRRHVMNAAAFAAGSTTDKALIHLNPVNAADAIALGSDHACPELMEDLEGGFIAGKPELP